MSSISPKSNGLSHRLNNTRDSIGEFLIGEKLGEGTFSKVCQGIHKTTREKVAIKIMSKEQIKEPSDKLRIEKEINIQKRLHHNNIIQQYSIIETKTTIYIITEYCSGGELFDYIISKRKLFEVEACRIFQQLISGLEYLHKQRIVHRDLKPENLLFDNKHNLKIADFGLSNDYKGKLSTPCGSPCYAAPEMVTGKKYNGSSVDIWSSGIVLYTMVCGYLPFEDDNQSILFGKIAKGLFTLPAYLSASCKDLIKSILVTDPSKRFGFEQIKHHPWFLSINSVMGKTIYFNSPGIFIKEDVIPIDADITKELIEKFNYDLKVIVNDIIRNKHNNLTTSYYLILKRKIRTGEKSISDISPNSELFLAYIKSSISKMKYWQNNIQKIIDHYYQQLNKIINGIDEDASSNSNKSSERDDILPTVNINTVTKLNFHEEKKENGGNVEIRSNSKNSKPKTEKKVMIKSVSEKGSISYSGNRAETHSINAYVTTISNQTGASYCTKKRSLIPTSNYNKFINKKTVGTTNNDKLITETILPLKKENGLETHNVQPPSVLVTEPVPYLNGGGVRPDQKIKEKEAPRIKPKKRPKSIDNVLTEANRNPFNIKLPLNFYRKITPARASKQKQNGGREITRNSLEKKKKFLNTSLIESNETETHIEKKVNSLTKKRNFVSHIKSTHYSQEHASKPLELAYGLNNGNNSFIENSTKKYTKMSKIRKQSSTSSANSKTSHQSSSVPKGNYKINPIKEKEIVHNQNKLYLNICCKKNLEKIKEIVSKTIGSKVSLIKNPSTRKVQLECKYSTKFNSMFFILNISKFSEVKDYFVIAPTLIKGNMWNFKMIFDKIKKELI